MADSFLGLSRADKRDALVVAASLSGRREHLLEKDIWVVWALRALFDSDFAGHQRDANREFINYEEAVSGGL